MRYILLIIFVFINTTLQAQSKKSVVSKKPLTEVELQKAIKMYEAMTHTPTYIALKKNNNIVFKKLGSTRYPPPEEMTKWYYDRALLRKWVSDNIKDTKFTSVDEGTELISKGINLYEKNHLENEELFNLVKRANIDQMGKILAPEHKELPGMY